MLNRTKKSSIINAGTDRLNNFEGYCSYFGFNYPPFNDTPEVPQNVFQSDTFSKALLKVLSGIKYGKTIAFLSGDKGAGKTTFFKYCQAMLKPHYAVATIINPRLPTHKLLTSICDDLGVKYPVSCQDKNKLVDNLKHYLLAAERRKERTFIIFDESEHLTSEMLLCLDPLLKLNQFGTKKLHVIFIGESGIQKRTAVQLSQQKESAFAHDFAFSMENSSIHGRIKPLTKKETIGYVSQKLKIGGAVSIIFTKAAVTAIYHYSGGMPKRINLLCDKAMRVAYKHSKPVVDYGVVRTVKSSVPKPNRKKPLDRVLTPFVTFLSLLSDTAFKTTHFNLYKPPQNELAFETAVNKPLTTNRTINENKQTKTDRYTKELLNDLIPSNSTKAGKSIETISQNQKPSEALAKGSHSNPLHSSHKKNATNKVVKETTNPSNGNFSHAKTSEELYPTDLLNDLVANRHTDNSSAPVPGYNFKNSNAKTKSDRSKLAQTSPYEHAILAASEQSSKQDHNELQNTKASGNQHPKDLFNSLLPSKNRKKINTDESNKRINSKPHSKQDDNSIKQSKYQSAQNKNIPNQVNKNSEFLFSEQLVGDLLSSNKKSKDHSDTDRVKTSSNKTNSQKPSQSITHKTEIQITHEQILPNGVHKRPKVTKTKKKWDLNAIKLLNGLKGKKKTNNTDLVTETDQSKTSGIENKKKVSEKSGSPHQEPIHKTIKQSIQPTSKDSQTKTAYPTKRRATIVSVPKGMVAIPEVVLASSHNYQNNVTVLPFFMDEKPVINAFYAQFIEETGYLAPEHWFGQRPAHTLLNHPVINISLEDARRYAQWSGKRLPLPEEWEAAARGQDNLKFPWGNEWDSSFSNNQSHGVKRTMHVDAFPDGISKEGCWDMVGNVWEWTEISEEDSELENEYAWVFGGSFRHPCNTNDNISRNAILQKNLYSYVGFRCAKDLT